jgi:hypothetical protein
MAKEKRIDPGELPGFTSGAWYRKEGWTVYANLWGINLKHFRRGWNHLAVRINSSQLEIWVNNKRRFTRDLFPETTDIRQRYVTSTALADGGMIAKVPRKRVMARGTL